MNRLVPSWRKFSQTEVPGACQVILGNTPDLVAEVLVFRIIVAVGGGFDPEEESAPSGRDDLLHLSHTRDLSPRRPAAGECILAEARRGFKRKSSGGPGFDEKARFVICYSANT